MGWIENNVEVVIGWMGTLLLFAFLFGRRLTKLENTDANLGKAVEALTATQQAMTATISELVRLVNGQDGNAVLAEAVRSLQATLAASNGQMHGHETRLVKLEEVRGYLENQFAALQRTQQEQGAAVQAQLQSIAVAITEIRTLIRKE